MKRTKITASAGLSSSQVRAVGERRRLSPIELVALIGSVLTPARDYFWRTFLVQPASISVAHFAEISGLLFAASCASGATCGGNGYVSNRAFWSAGRTVVSIAG